MIGKRFINDFLYNLYQLFWAMIDWIYPPNCAGCEKFSERWCIRCESQTKPVPTPICPLCGKPQLSQSICMDCTQIPPPYTMMRSAKIYQDPLRQAIHRLKYKQDIGISEILARDLITYFKTLNWNVDLITAVPLSKQRLAQRGFNQSAFLAIPLALSNKIPFRSNILIRTRNTETQVKLDAYNRKKNVEGAFYSNSSEIYGKNILIVDDVITTGSTMFACSQALLDGGANHIYALSLARAGLRSDTVNTAIQ